MRTDLIDGSIIAAEDMKVIGMSVANRVIEGRTLKNLSKAELSKKTKIPLAQLEEIEGGERMLNIREAKSIAKVLGLTPQYIIAG